jgi:hypothetical protein
MYLTQLIIYLDFDCRLRTVMIWALVASLLASSGNAKEAVSWEEPDKPMEYSKEVKGCDKEPWETKHWRSSSATNSQTGHNKCSAWHDVQLLFSACLSNLFRIARSVSYTLVFTQLHIIHPWAIIRVTRVSANFGRLTAFRAPTSVLDHDVFNTPSTAPRGIS